MCQKHLASINKPLYALMDSTIDLTKELKFNVNDFTKVGTDSAVVAKFKYLAKNWQAENGVEKPFSNHLDKIDNGANMHSVSLRQRVKFLEDTAGFGSSVRSDVLRQCERYQER